MREVEACRLQDVLVWVLSAMLVALVNANDALNKSDGEESDGDSDDASSDDGEAADDDAAKKDEGA